MFYSKTTNNHKIWLEANTIAVNDFLDNVLVMHENPAVKENRIHLLTLTFSLISPLGDIKKLS